LNGQSYIIFHGKKPIKNHMKKCCFARAAHISGKSVDKKRRKLKGEAGKSENLISDGDLILLSIEPEYSLFPGNQIMDISTNLTN